MVLSPRSATAALLLSAFLAGCGAKPRPPAESAPLAQGEPAGYVGFRFGNGTAWSAVLILVDTVRGEAAEVDLGKPAQEIHIGTILEPQGPLELPPEAPVASPPTVVKLRPGAWRVAAVELRREGKRARLEGSGAIIPVEAGLFTYIGRISLSRNAATRAFKAETAEYDPEDLRGIEGRVPLKVRVTELH